HLARDHVHLRAAVGDDRVHADRVLVAERLADGVDRRQADLRRVERVDPHVRRAAGVRGAPQVTHGLHDAAVVRARHAGLAVLRPRRHVDHHRHVDVVEVAEPEQLRLAAEEFQPARARLRHAPLDVAVLLGRHREEDDAPGQVIEGPRVEQPHGGAEQAGDLGVVAAGVGRAGLRIGHRVAGDDETIELPEQRERRALAGAARHVGPHPGQRQAGLGAQPELAQGLLVQARGIDFLEAELRVLPDLLAEADDVLAALVDRPIDALLQLVPGHGRSSGAILPAMDYHHVIEAAGIVSLGLVFYSYLIRALDGAPAAWRRWRPVATGVAFGAVAVALMIARIYVGHDRFIDARAVPIALVTLIEGVEAGAVTAAIAAGARRYGDVVKSHAAEAARRDAAQLRAVASLARAAAHEINNPLTAVLGGLALANRSLPPGSEEAKWMASAKEGAEQIRDIV